MLTAAMAFVFVASFLAATLLGGQAAVYLAFRRIERWKEEGEW